VATTTVATMLGVMHKKRLVKRRRGPRGLVWSANVSRDAAAKGIVARLVDRVFDGSASLLVTHLLDNLELSEDDRRQIRDALAKGRELPEQGPQP
jgi:predicted transcriptional regulator